MIQMTAKNLENATTKAIASHKSLTIEQQSRMAVMDGLNVWRVPSSSRRGAFRLVKRLADGSLECSCMGYLVARRHDRYCRHVVAVLMRHWPEPFLNTTCCDYWAERSFPCPRSEAGQEVFRAMSAAA